MIRSDADFRQAQDRRAILAATLEDRAQRERLSLTERASLEGQVAAVDHEIRAYVSAVAETWLTS